MSALTFKMTKEYAKCSQILRHKLSVSVQHTHCSRQLFVHILLETLGHLVKTVQLTSHTTNKIQIFGYLGLIIQPITLCLFTMKVAS